MKRNHDKNLTSLEDHLDQQYGKIGTPERKEFESGFEIFKHDVMMQEYKD